VGVLFAPKSGKELREELKEKGDKAFGEAKHFYGEAREKSRAILEDASHRAEELRHEANRQLTEARLKAKEILKGAEEKASGLVDEAKSEAKKVKGAMEAGVEAARHEFSKREKS
jgi:gas vesicle protein